MWGTPSSTRAPSERWAMIAVSLRLVVPRERRTEVLRTLRSLVGPTGAQAGCARCELYRDALEDGVYLYVEEWGSREQLERHIRSSRYRRLLAVMEAASEQPDVRYDTVSERQGFELVEAVRSPGTVNAQP